MEMDDEEDEKLLESFVKSLKAFAEFDDFLVGKYVKEIPEISSPDVESIRKFFQPGIPVIHSIKKWNTSRPQIVFQVKMVSLRCDGEVLCSKSFLFKGAIS